MKMTLKSLSLWANNARHDWATTRDRPYDCCHLAFCSVLAKFATDPHKELLEYIRRDILNTALRNTDNHGRNTAFLKPADKTVALSPLCDFAPMFLDPEGIARSARWGGGLEPVIARPAWGRIAESLSAVLDPRELGAMMARDAAEDHPAFWAEDRISGQADAFFISR